MGIFADRARRALNMTVAELDQTMDWQAFGGPPTSAGMNISEDSALRFITVYSCIKVLAETMGSMPRHVYRKRQDGRGADLVTDHPAVERLGAAPNEEMHAQTLIEQQTGHVAGSGNCYSIITRSNRGTVLDLYPVDWHKMRPVRDENRRLMYRLDDRGQPEYFPPDRVLHVLGLSFNGVYGYSPIGMARECIGLGMAASRFASLFFSQGLNISGVIVHPDHLDAAGKAYDNLRKSIESRNCGLENAHRPMLLEEGMKWERAPIPLEDAQFVELLQSNRQDLCGLFRVPPHMIADLTRSTNNNIEWQSLEFIKFTMLPWIVRWENALNRRLFSARERAQGYYMKFSVEGLLRGDYKSRQEGLHIQRQDGIINADEWRSLEEMNPQEGENGKTYFINGNMISVDTAAKQPPRQAGAAPSQGGGDDK